MPIKISMTEANVRRAWKQAKPQLGGCRYTSPCIIGAMMTPRQRKRLAELNLDNRSVGYLVDQKAVEIDNLELARDLQHHFDVEDAAGLEQRIEQEFPS